MNDYGNDDGFNRLRDVLAKAVQKMAEINNREPDEDDEDDYPDWVTE